MASHCLNGSQTQNSDPSWSREAWMLPAKSSSNSCKVRNMIWNGWDLLGHVNGGTVWNNECLFFNSGAFHSPGLADLHEARAACVGYVFFFAKTVGRTLSVNAFQKIKKILRCSSSSTTYYNLTTTIWVDPDSAAPCHTGWHCALGY